MVQLQTNYKTLKIVFTPTNMGVNAEVEVKRQCSDIRMVLPGLPPDRVQAVLNALSGTVRDILEDRDA